jgi:hypothetical protein
VEAATTLSHHPQFWRLVETGSCVWGEFFVLAGPAGRPLATRPWLQPTDGPATHHDIAPGDNASNKGGLSNSGDIGSGYLPTEWRVRSWLSDVALGAGAAHSHGITLGNISPYTVWIANDGSAMLMDPGVRGKHDWHDGADGSAGSPAAFLAPERVLGHPPAPAVDIYALGAVLFWQESFRHINSGVQRN